MMEVTVAVEIGVLAMVVGDEATAHCFKVQKLALMVI